MATLDCARPLVSELLGLSSGDQSRAATRGSPLGDLIPAELHVEGQPPLTIAIFLEMSLTRLDDATSDTFRNIWIPL